MVSDENQRAYHRHTDPLSLFLCTFCFYLEETVIQLCLFRFMDALQDVAEVSLSVQIVDELDAVRRRHVSAKYPKRV